MDQFQILLKAVLDTQSIGKSDLAEVQKVLNKYHLNLAADLNKAELVKTIKTIVPELEAELKKITGINIKIDDKTITKTVNQIISDTARLNKENEKLANTMANLREKAEQNRISEEKRQQASQNSATQKMLEREIALQEKINQGFYQIRIDEYSQKFQKYGLSVEGASEKVSRLQTTLNQMKNFSGQKLIDEENKFQQELLQTNIALRQAKLEYDKFAQPVSGDKVTSLLLKIQNFLSKNTAVTKEADIALRNYITELNGGNISLSRWNQINGELKKTEANMRGLGRLGMSLKDQMSRAASSFTQWISVSTAIMTVIYQLRKMPKAVYDIDTAMTSLYKVTDETSVKYQTFLNNSTTKAQELGRSVSSLIEQAATWAKLGYSLEDSAKLSEISSIYANVGEVDDATAVSDLVTAMKAYNIEASGTITIVDSLNDLGNKYATDAASLGEGLKNSASALKLAGNDINQALAMLTGGTEIIQNASEMGNALKVLSMRIRGMKGELEDLGEEYDNVESISKIQTQILNQTQGAVNIFDDTGNFKSTYEILKDISVVWDKISKTDQAALLETIAGKQRGNQVAALIQAFQSGQVDKAYADSVNSSGSAMKEQERWMSSLEAKTQQFQAAFQSLSQTALDTDFLKGIVDFGTGAVNALDDLINKIGIAIPLVTTLTGIWQKDRSIQRFCPSWV